MTTTAPELAARLRSIRLASGFSQDDIATKAGLTRVAYNRIETGKAEPRPVTVQAIAKAFGLTLADTLASVPKLSGVRFRANLNQDAFDDQFRAHIEALVARKIQDVRFLEDDLGRPPETNSSISKLKTGDPREVAQNIRKAFKLNEHEPIRDICGLVEAHGITVLTVVIRRDGFFGLSIDDQASKRQFIVVNIADHISVERMIFTCAHELGHLVLHHQDYRKDEGEENREHEDGANFFAAELLMPHKAFVTEWKKYDGYSFVDRVLAVKRYFSVSYKAVLVRLDQHKVPKVFMRFNGEYKKRFGVSLGKADEPHALRRDQFCLPVENIRAAEPEALRKHDFMEPRVYSLVKDAVKREIISLSRASEILNLPMSAVREMAISWAEASDVEDDDLLN